MKGGIKNLIHIVLLYPSFLRIKREITKAFNQKPEIIFFFPAYQMGGAERIHLEILKSCKGNKTLTLVCYKSSSDHFKPEFEKESSIFIDIGLFGNYPFFQDQIVGLIKNFLNTHSNNATVLGCNVFYFYDIIDSIQNKRIKRVDLLHAFSPYTKGTEKRSISSVPNLDGRIVINEKTKQDYKQQYEEEGVTKEFLNRIKVIYNPLLEPFEVREVNKTLQFTCLWVGRGSKEKRPWIFGKLAKLSNEKALPISFEMAGDVNDLMGQGTLPFVKLHGKVTDAQKLKSIYKRANVLVTTSSYEGFPLTMIEAISFGLVNVSVDVGGISEHIKDGHTGILVQDGEEETIVLNLLHQIQVLYESEETRKKLFENSQKYVEKTFSYKRFVQGYQIILNPNERA